MKKLLLLFAFATSAVSASAQTFQGEQSLFFQGGYQTNYNRVLIGAQYRYLLADEFCIAPDVTFFFPKNNTSGLDLNINLHYVFGIDYQLSVYPLAGLNMSNNRFSGRIDGATRIDSYGYTNWGFNLGGGASYNLYGGNSFLNFEAKYIFSDIDSFVFSLGYGIRF